MIWLTIIISGLLTFGARFSMIGIFKDRQLPELVRRLLVYVAPATLAAIILPDILTQNNQISLAQNPQIPAFLVAVGVAFVTRNVIVIIISGMVALWLIEAFLW